MNNNTKSTHSSLKAAQNPKMQKPPKVSIISISPSKEKLNTSIDLIEHQTFKDYEVISEIGGFNVVSLNRAIAKSSGDILVFLDPEAVPVNDRWLADLISEVKDERTIVKGLEVTSSPLNSSSLAGYREAFADNPFDETYLWSEDSELFCRLNEKGYEFVQLDCAPVIHHSKPGSKTYLRRSFKYGLYWSKLRYRYMDPVRLAKPSEVFKQMMASLLNLTGICVGKLLYKPRKNMQYKV